MSPAEQLETYSVKTIFMDWKLTRKVSVLDWLMEEKVGLGAASERTQVAGQRLRVASHGRGFHLGDLTRTAPGTRPQRLQGMH